MTKVMQVTQLMQLTKMTVTFSLRYAAGCFAKVTVIYVSLFGVCGHGEDFTLVSVKG
jgi:hypothetical protein